jgi:uncharacterized protein YkuJ
MAVLTNNILFIIAHKYIKSYKTYLQYTIDNVIKFYPNNHILIVDNNSEDIRDIIQKYELYKNVKIIINNTPCKFELGAYKRGIEYLLSDESNGVFPKWNTFDYCVFCQDTMVLKNKYNFQNLKENKITACTIYRYIQDHHFFEITKQMLESANLFDSIDKITCCVFSSFILHSSKMQSFLEITKPIAISTKRDSEACERALARILYELNDNRNFDIDGCVYEAKYDIWNSKKIDIDVETECPHYFFKVIQNKTEHTK